MAEIAENDDKRKIATILSFLSSIESDSDDEENFHLERNFVPKIEGFIENLIDKFNDHQFKKFFRVNRQTANVLIDRFRESCHFPKNDKHGGRTPLSAEAHIFSFLWFAGNKSTLQDVSQRFNMTISSFFRVMNRVINFLLEIGPTIIKMPNSDEEKEYMATKFKKISGFPCVIGCIDGTSIAIRTPSKKIKSTYTNRHDIPSITMQGICDYKRRFIDVFTGIPGKIHDARVFKMSDISKKLPNICGKRYHILGDGAYFIRTWLLTPYKDYGTLTEERKVYNKKISATRVRIENSFGILKSRFRQLLRVDMHHVVRTTGFILSCCILHNLCIDFDDLIDEHEVSCDDNDQQDNLSLTEHNLRKKGEEKRDFIKTSFRFEK